MKSLAAIVVVNVLTILLGAWLVSNPPSPQTFAAAPSANTLLVIVGLIAALPLLKRYGKAYLTLWVEETKGLVSTGKGLVAVVGQRVGGPGIPWKTLVTTLVLGVVIGLFFGGGVKWPTIDWPNIIPPVIVTPDGPRRILIVRETADATPQLNGELVLMRKDPIDAYLKGKGHRLDILDLDAKDKDGAPIKAVTEFKASYATLKPPAILIQAEDKTVVHAASLPADVKASAILDTIKAKE